METLITAETLHPTEPLGPLRLPEDTLAIVLPSKGLMEIAVAGKRNDVGPGMAALIAPQLNTMVDAFPQEGYLIIFDCELWKRFLKTHAAYRFLGLFDSASLRLLPVPATTHIIARLLTNDVILVGDDSQGGPVRWHLLSAVLLQLCESFRLTKKLPNYGQLHPELDKLTDLIEHHFRQERRAGFYAEQLGMSVRALNQLSKRMTGSSTSELIDDRTMSEAECLLSETTYQIKQIAYELGFGTPEGFTHFFKNKSGLQPIGYRRKTRTRTIG